MERKIFKIIGACSGWGAKFHGCEKGPEAVIYPHEERFPHTEKEMLYPRQSASTGDLPPREAIVLIQDFNLRLAAAVQKTLNEGKFPLVLGGDHVNAVGTWNGVNAYEASQGRLPFGLIWIDAHMDANTPQTSQSSAWHGMPLAALMGYGDRRIAQLLQDAPVLSPQHICLIGVRSFEEGEAALLEKLSVKIYFMEEVERRGFAAVFQEAIALMNAKTASFGVSIDLDAIDPEDAPGVGSPVPWGIKGADFLTSFSSLIKEEKWVALEIVEYNPEKETDGKTKELIDRIIKGAIYTDS